VCKEVVAKGGLVTECLAKNEDTLSEDCKRQFLWKWKVSQLCKEDMDRLCKEVVKGGGSLGKCFQDKEKELSDKCRAALVRGSRQAKAEDKAEAKAEAKVDDAPAKPRRKRGAAAKKAE